MPHPHTVLRSVNLPGEHVCVDLFRRPDGTFGFEEYRREPEDGRGWFVIGHADEVRSLAETYFETAGKLSE